MVIEKQKGIQYRRGERLYMKLGNQFSYIYQLPVPEPYVHITAYTALQSSHKSVCCVTTRRREEECCVGWVGGCFYCGNGAWAQVISSLLTCC